MHLYTYIHASSFGRRTQKNRHKNNIKIYAYIFIRVYASFGRHPIHQVRTGFGDSNKSYGGSNWLIPIHGIGQWNGVGPAIWVVISTPLLNLLRKKGYGCKLVDPISGNRYRFVGYTFVDDTDIIESKPMYSGADQTSRSLQCSMDVWEGSLNATFGAIVPEKTF